MKRISMILSILIIISFLFSACSINTEDEEKELAKIKLIQEQEPQTTEIKESQTITGTEESTSDSNTNSKDQEDKDDTIYYYGWVLYETGEHSQTDSIEYISTYSTLYRVTAKLVNQGSEDWLYFQQMLVLDKGSYENYKENPCQPGLTYLSSQETRSASDTLYFENPENFFTETYMGYINPSTGEYVLNIRPQITGNKKTTYNTVLYEFQDPTDGDVLREDAPTDGSDYSCVFGEDSSSSTDYKVPDFDIGSNGDPEACAALTLDDEYITYSSDCKYLTQNGDLVGSFYDSLDLSDSATLTIDVKTEWVNIEWNLKRKDCGTDCSFEVEDDLFSWSEFDLESSPLLKGEVEWLWE